MQVEGWREGRWPVRGPRLIGLGRSPPRPPTRSTPFALTSDPTSFATPTTSNMEPPTEPNLDPFATSYSLPFELAGGPDLSSAFLSGGSQAPFDWTQFDASAGFAEQGAYQADDLLVGGGHINHDPAPVAGPSNGAGPAVGDDSTSESRPKSTHKRPPRPAKPPPPGSILADRSCARCRERKGKSVGQEGGLSGLGRRLSRWRARS